MKSSIPILGCRSTKIYCRPGCPPGRRTKPENRVYFRSREEAIATGYRPCKVCRPDDTHPETFYVSEYRSPVGSYLLASSQWGVVGVKSDKRSQLYIDRWEKDGISITHDPSANRELAEQLDSYFAGELRRFTVPLDLRGTPFQRRVWDILNTIPWGGTVSYGQVAAKLGHPRGARAVGRAVGTNPVAIVVPCHRVLGSDGSLTGYGGGLERKMALLRLEGITYRND